MPPPLPSESRRSGNRTAKLIIIGVCSVALISAVCFAAAVYYFSTSGIFSRPLDNKFGDQHLKTTISLLELHKLRYGRYPHSVKELKFVGDWDQLALSSVRYYPAHDGSKYYVEVARGWVAKPVLEYPPEFWQGTGYSPSLRPHSQQ